MTPLTYTIVVRNTGPGDVTGATIQDTFPAALTNVTYVSTTTGTVTGNTASGNGNIDDLVNMTAGSSITYTVSATIRPNATGQLQNTATVAPPVGVTDPNPEDNTSTDIDTLTPEVDLAVTKTNSQINAIPLQPLSYTVTVTNSGPSDVLGAQVADVFPNELMDVQYTSTATNGASGNTADGQGDINDTVNLPVGATITYSVTSFVRGEATQDVTNTATITPPTGTTERNPADNTDQHTDLLVPGVDLAITKSADRTVIGPGQSLTYTIVVRNIGPNPVTDAHVTDTFPGLLNGVSYTSQATAGASGNTTSGSGDIDDRLDLAVGSSVTYIATGTTADVSSGTLQNTANVVAPPEFTELNSANNSDTESTQIDSLLSSISGFVYLDRNNDGIRDPGEPPISDVEIILDRDENEFDRTVTDEAGAYRFDNLTAGAYFVFEVQPAGYRNGKMTVGGGLGEIAGPDTFFVQLGNGQNATELNYGERSLQPSKRDLLASSFAD